jgi:queuine tRNA-ribosyltransferase
MFTPEYVIDIQRSIGADIIMAFDECTPGDADYQYAQKSYELTQRWLERCIQRYGETKCKYGYHQSLFPIVQGCVYKDLRIKAAEKISELNTEGIAIGGLSVGEEEQVMYEMIEVVNQVLPQSKPRYLMGVGTPVNILEAIDRGVDMFDCVLPTRNGRNGMLYTRNGIINIRNNKWSTDFSPIEEEGTSVVDRDYSKAYLRHLFQSKEMLGPQLASIHNLSFFLWLVGEARKQILEGNFKKWKEKMVQQLGKRL